MKVVLLDNIRGVGRVGDVKDVADGYARNMLFPKKLARAATAGALKDIEALKAKKLKVLELAQKEAGVVADKLKDATITIKSKANDQGTLFAGIEAGHIAKAISETIGASLDASSVELHEHIKTVGEYTVPVHLAHEISVPVDVVVTSI